MHPLQLLCNQAKTGLADDGTNIPGSTCEQPWLQHFLLSKASDETLSLLVNVETLSCDPMRSELFVALETPVVKN